MVLNNSLGIKKVVIWGHPLHSHTHSYIHEGFYRAFQYLGFETHWLDNKPVDKADFESTLFLTEGQVSGNMPSRSDCYYVLHNSFVPAEYKKLLVLQFLHSEITTPNLERLNPWTLFSAESKVLYQPWSTNLLPHEIDLIKRPRDNAIYYVGTVSDSGGNNNAADILGFARGCQKKNIPFHVYGGYTGNVGGGVKVIPGFVSNADHISLIHKSYLAPQFSSIIQKETGYIPCRIFKNISYGQYGITNSAAVQEVFEGNLIYADSGEELFEESERKKDTQDLESLIKLVQEKHTFVNRAKTILECMERV